jgi:hypothetical protein
MLTSTVVAQFEIVWATVKRTMTQTVTMVMEADFTIDTTIDQQTHVDRHSLEAAIIHNIQTYGQIYELLGDND